MAAHLEISQDELEITGHLGFGGNANVYKAIWKVNNERRPVAIKEIVNYDKSVEELCKEAELQQPGVLTKVHGVSILDNHSLWIIMEIVEKGDLRSFLNSHELPLPLETQIIFCFTATCAIANLHHRKPPVLHKDIKSYNFLVRENTLILTDFGMAKSVEEAGKTIGTLAWTPPEVLRGDSEWTEKSDIFSLGMVFYEIVSRKLPFDEVDSKDISGLITSGQRPTIPDDCLQGLKDIIRSCWADDPQERPSAHSLVGKLNTLLEENSAIIGMSNEEKRKERSAIDLEECGLSPLGIAAVLNNPEQVRPLVDDGEDLEETNTQGQTALMLAAGCGNIEVIKELLNCGANIHARDAEGYSVLMQAVSTNSIGCVELLLENGALAEDCSDDGGTILILSTLVDVRFVELLVHYGARVDKPDLSGRTPLMIAAKLGKTKHVKKLIELRANVNAMDKQQMTPLMHGCWSGVVSVVETLIENGADVDIAQEDGLNCLAYAALGGEIKLLEVVLKHMIPEKRAFEHAILQATMRNNIPAWTLLLQHYEKHGFAEDET